MLFSDLKHPNPEVQDKVEEVFKKFFSNMLENSGGYESLRTKYLSSIKDIYLNRHGALWLSLWHGGEVLVEGFSAPSTNSIQDRSRMVVEILTACGSIPFECGQIAYVVPREDDSNAHTGFIWSLAPTVSCAEGWTIADAGDLEDGKVSMEHLSKSDYSLTQHDNDCQNFGGFITVFMANVFQRDEDNASGQDIDLKIFAQYLRERGHDLTFNFDKMFVR